jgi:tRNA(fMet)-specific endonuclease VapC
MLYCIDSNLVIDIYRGDGKELIGKIRALQEQQVQICINPIIVSELFKGAYLTPYRKEQAVMFVEEFISDFKILSFTKEAARLYGEKFAELKKQGKQTQDFDLIVATICMTHNAILITRNPKHFKNIKGLKYVVW